MQENNLDMLNIDEIFNKIKKVKKYNTQKQIADYFEVSEGALSQWKKSRIMPSKHYIKYSLDILKKGVAPNMMKGVEMVQIDKDKDGNLIKTYLLTGESFIQKGDKWVKMVEEDSTC